MALFLVATILLALLTFGFLIAYFVTGAKNNTLRYLAGGFGILNGLLWIIKNLVR